MAKISNTAEEIAAVVKTVVKQEMGRQKEVDSQHQSRPIPQRQPARVVNVERTPTRNPNPFGIGTIGGHSFVRGKPPRGGNGDPFGIGGRQ